MDTVNGCPRDLNNFTQNERIYCICRSTSILGFMIMCDICDVWYHGDCIGVTEGESKWIDMYCCNECRTKNPMLKTTYKKPKGMKRFVEVTEKYRLTSGSIVTESFQGKETEINRHISEAIPAFPNFEFIDRAIPKIKSDSCQGLNGTSEVQLPNKKPKRLKTENIRLKEYYIPGCKKTSRTGENYYDNQEEEFANKCMLNLTQSQEEEHVENIPSFNEELSRKKLDDVWAKVKDVEKLLEAVDIKIIQLIVQIQEWKHPGNVFKEVQCDGATNCSIFCSLCGIAVHYRAIERHLRQCYNRLDVKSYVTDWPNNKHWNVFCNYEMIKNRHCKRMKVLCPYHYKDCRKDGEICGYMLGKFNGVTKYCGNISGTCNHGNWEERLRAELDLEKLKLFLKFHELKEEEAKIIREINSHGNSMGLLMLAITHTENNFFK